MHTTTLLSWLGELEDIWKAGRFCSSSPKRAGDSALEVLDLDGGLETTRGLASAD
jgi:hypothetical protein